MFQWTFLNRFSFDRITVTSLWPEFYGALCSWAVQFTHGPGTAGVHVRWREHSSPRRPWLCALAVCWPFRSSCLRRRRQCSEKALLLLLMLEACTRQLTMRRLHPADNTPGKQQHSTVDHEVPAELFKAGDGHGTGQNAQNIICVAIWKTGLSGQRNGRSPCSSHFPRKAIINSVQITEQLLLSLHSVFIQCGHFQCKNIFKKFFE